MALLAASGQLADKLPETITRFQRASPESWWGLLAFLLGVGLWLLRDGLSKRSRLLQPEALSLRAENRQHLKGRVDDIDLLCALCEQHKLVFLEGESGVGKSALVQAGLIPRVIERGSFLPIYLSGWSGDWEKGPASSVSDSLWRSFSDADCKALDLLGPPNLTQVKDLLRELKQKVGKTALVIFDQFDDYQTLNRSRFLAGAFHLAACSRAVQCE